MVAKSKLFFNRKFLFVSQESSFYNKLSADNVTMFYYKPD